MPASPEPAKTAFELRQEDEARLKAQRAALLAARIRDGAAIARRKPKPPPYVPTS